MILYSYEVVRNQLIPVAFRYQTFLQLHISRIELKSKFRLNLFVEFCFL